MSMEETDFELYDTDFQLNKDKLLAAIKILETHKDPSKYFEDDNIENIFYLIYSFTNLSYGKEDVLEICEFFLQNNFHIILIRLIDYFKLICETLKPPYSQNASVEDNRKITLFAYTQYISNFLFAYSINFRIKYFEADGLRSLLELISNDKFIQTLSDERFLQFIIMNINQLSRDSDLYKNEWNELNAANCLLKVAKIYNFHKVHAYAAFLNIATDKQINTTPEIQEIIPIFVRQLHKSAHEIQISTGFLEREKIQFNEEDEAISQQYDVYHVSDDDDVNLKRSLTGIINTLYRLAVNDKIKYDLFVKHNLKESLKIIIFKGVDIEKKYALKLLAQLCFDAQVVDIVSKDNELIKYIESISCDINCTINSLPKVCKQVLWSIKMNSSLRDVGEIKNNLNQKSQIMISYNSSSRDLCIKIKNELEKAGFKIWIDIDEIHGSSLDSMARAVETSDIILMCVTEKYRQSINCQAEAQYAFKLKKSIIPIIMQKGYENVDGWLGMIMGDRIYISFIKYAFDESIKKLLSQITLLHPVSQAINTTVSSIVNHSSSNSLPQAFKKEDIIKWTEQQVEEWFRRNEHLTIYEKIKPCDGELLFQLHKMHLSAPEFFFQSISTDKKYDLRKILVFTKQFEKLFSD